MTKLQDAAGRRAQSAGHGATGAELDRAIDGVARQMTEGSPASAADFRRGVLARIEANRAPHTTWRAEWVFSPLAAAAVIVLAIFVARGFQPRDRGPERATPQETAAAQSLGPQPQTVLPEQVQVRLKPDVTVRAATARTATNRSGTTRATTAPGLSFGAEAIEALAAPSLALASLTADALTPDPIQLERLDTTSPITTLPITIAPITVAPLDITDGQRRNE